LLLIPFLVILEGCPGWGEIIDKSYLSSAEIERIESVNLYKANELDPKSYKFIKKVEGLSCTVFSILSKDKHASVEKAIEQTRIYAARAGGNGVINLLCQNIKNDYLNNCFYSIKCTGDAIQVD
jgi:hypothetical protein